jgi:hypothetical protein
MANLVETGLGGSRMQKEADKDLYWKPNLLIPGDGIQFTLVDLITKEELDAVMQDADGRMMYPQASQTQTGLMITTSGYSGTVSGSLVSSFNIELVNGLIVGVTVAD